LAIPEQFDKHLKPEICGNLNFYHMFFSSLDAKDYVSCSFFRM